MEGGHTITYVHKIKTVERDGEYCKIESRITKEVWTPDSSDSYWDYSEEPEYFFSDDSYSDSEDEEIVDVMSDQVVPSKMFVAPEAKSLEQSAQVIVSNPKGARAKQTKKKSNAIKNTGQAASQGTIKVTGIQAKPEFLEDKLLEDILC